MSDLGVLIPKNISMDEPCLRCIFHPLQISSGKIRREALLPAAGRSDVSLLRQNYTTIDECIRHGKGIIMNGQTFVAIASITRQHLDDNNKWASESDAAGNTIGIQADIYYAPMITQDKYADLKTDIYSQDPDIALPAHADMRYAQILDGTVKTRMRQYASRLVKSMTLVAIV